MNGDIRNEYFDWICGNFDNPAAPNRRLFMLLHTTTFEYENEMDHSRYVDGITLRRKFMYRVYNTMDTPPELNGPCSVLEMMCVLAEKLEDTMCDPEYGDRTRHWFWDMLGSMGIANQRDGHFHRSFCERAIYRMMHHKYEPNGKGGLFTIHNPDLDMRDMHIWWQMGAYIHEVI